MILVTATLAIALAWPFVDVSLGGDHYLFLARSFLHARLDVDSIPSFYGDFVSSGGHKYLPFGPVPALLLVPFVPLMNAGVPMVWAGYLLTAVNAFLFYRLLEDVDVPRESRAWGTLLYFAGTPYLGVAIGGISTYFAHIVCTFFLLIAIRESLRGKRWVIAGLCIGLAAGARMTAIFAVPFFLYMILQSDRKSVAMIKLAFGLAIPVAAIAAYNAMRFGSPLETGFGLAELYTPTLDQARNVGLFSIAHIPKNLFMMLFKGVDAIPGDGAAVLRFPFITPSKWGMGLLFTSPALLYALRAPRSNHVRASWLVIPFILVPIVMYYGIGYVQFGYRYALDFMPFLALLASIGLPRPLSPTARLLISMSVLICVWGSMQLAIWI